MGLSQCPDCGGKLSSEAVACPHCGRPMKRPQSPSIIVAPDKSGGCARTGCLVIVFGLLGVFVLFLIAVFASSSSSPKALRNTNNMPSSRSVLQPRTSAKPEYDLLASKWRWHHEYGFVTAEGTVKNISNAAIKNVTAVVSFETEDGQFITSDEAIIAYNPILPGQTSPWKVMGTWNPAMSKAHVSFKTLLGGTILTDQEP